MMYTTRNEEMGSLGQPALADTLRARRLELGLSQAELARYVSPSCQPADIDALESNRSFMPSWIRLRQLADALEVPVNDLIPPSPPAPKRIQLLAQQDRAYRNV